MEAQQPHQGCDGGSGDLQGAGGLTQLPRVTRAPSHFIEEVEVRGGAHLEIWPRPPPCSKTLSPKPGPPHCRSTPLLTRSLCVL